MRSSTHLLALRSSPLKSCAAAAVSVHQSGKRHYKV